MEADKINEILQNNIKEERVFLHDISNQLVVAQGMGTFALKKFKSEFGDDDKRINRLEKSVNAVNNIIEMVKERRSRVQSLSN